MAQAETWQDTARSIASRLMVLIVRNGNINTVGFRSSRRAKDNPSCNRLYISTPLMAFSFANCRNIEVIDVRPPEKLQRAGRGAGSRRAPLQVINILHLAGIPIVWEDGSF